MTAQNYTLRLDDELRKWLERNGLPKARQLTKDLENLRIITRMAERDEERNHLLRSVAEALGIISVE